MKKNLIKIGVVLIWLLIWQGIAVIVDSALFLPSPTDTLKALLTLMKTPVFYKSIGYSLLNITKGFVLGLLFGIALSALSYMIKAADVFLELPIRVIRAVPVASFTILALLWINSSSLSVLVSFLMVLPVIYTNFLSGLKETDKKLIEMADVFRVKKTVRIRYIYIPAALPALLSGIKTAVGLAWKSGVAAEVIGIAKNSIGYNLYEAKNILETENIFAWTLVTIIISILFEKLAILIINTLKRLILGSEPTNEDYSGEYKQNIRR